MKTLARGFTLLEVLVVLAIIAGLMAMVSLSGSDRHSEDETQRAAQHMTTLFNAYRNEAVFQNVDLGLAMSEQEWLLLSFQDIRLQEFRADKSVEELGELSANPWQPYAGSLKSEWRLPQDVSMSLAVEGQAVDFNELLEGSQGPIPALMFSSSDEYTPFELVLRHQGDERFLLHIEGDGLNAPRLKVERFEF